MTATSAALAAALSAAVSVALASGAFGQRVGAAGALLAIAGAAGLCALRAWPPARRALHALPASPLALLAVLAAANVLARALPPRPYGDLWLVRFLVAGEPAPRWLLGTAALEPVFRGIWLPLAGGLGGGLVFARLGAIAVCATCALLLLRGGAPLSRAAPLLTPLWILFAVGHPEYYPYIAGPFLLALSWLFARPLEERGSLRLAALAGTLPALYVGFVPVALCLLLALGAADARRALRVAAVAVALYAAWVALAWPGGVVDYFRALGPELNLGERNTVHPAYFGRSAGPWLPFFAPAYALSPEHLRHLAYLAFFGAGPGVAALALGAALGAGRRLARAGTGGLPRGSHVVFGALLCAAYGAYFVFMIPKLGPRSDVDLFFAPYLVGSACAGAVLDWSGARRARALAVPVLLGALVPGAYFLVVAGIPRI